MASASIKSPSAIILMVPSDRVFAHIQSALIAVFVEGHQDIHVGIKIFVAVPFVSSLPRGRQELGTGMFGINNVDRSLLDVGVWVLDAGVIAKIAPHHLSIPRPLVFGVRRSMDAHESTTCLDVTLEISLL